MKLTQVKEINSMPKLLPNKLMTELALGILVYSTYQHKSCCHLI